MQCTCIHSYVHAPRHARIHRYSRTEHTYVTRTHAHTYTYTHACTHARRYCVAHPNISAVLGVCVQPGAGAPPPTPGSAHPTFPLTPTSASMTSAACADFGSPCDLLQSPTVRARARAWVLGRETRCAPLRCTHACVNVCGVEGAHSPRATLTGVRVQAERSARRCVCVHAGVQG